MSIEARQIQETLYSYNSRHIEFHSLAPGIARQIWRMLRTKCLAVIRQQIPDISRPTSPCSLALANYFTMPETAFHVMILIMAMLC